MVRRFFVTAVATVAIVAVPAAASFAHECFVVNRSATGTDNVGHSGQWVVIDVEDALVEELGLTEELASAVVAEMEEQGLPTRFAVRTSKTLLEGKAGSDKSGDGKGIDHFFSGPYFEQMLAILADLGVEPLPE